MQISEFLFQQGRKIGQESEHLQELLDEQVEDEVNETLLRNHKNDEQV